MKKIFVIIYAVFSFIGFAAIVGFTGYFIYKSYEKLSIARERAFPGFRDEALSWYTEARSFRSELFIQSAKTAIEKDPLLMGIYIYSPKDGVVFWTNSTYLKHAPSNQGALSTVGWAGKPEYKDIPVGSQVYSLRFIDSADGGLLIDAIYWPVDIKEISPYIKWAFFVLFVWLIFSIIIRLFMSTGSVKEAYELETEAAGRDNRGGNIGYMTGESYRETEKESEHDRIRTRDKGENLHEAKKDGPVGLFSPSTGLGWQDHIDERLKFEITRTASFNQDMVFAFIVIDNFERVNNTTVLYKGIAKIILNSFPFQDLAFEHGKDGYAIILPDMDIQQGIKSLDLFQRKIAKTDFGFEEYPTISIGMSSRNGRLLSEKTLIQEAEKALSKAVQEGGQKIIAFKADADKFRKVIADKY